VVKFYFKDIPESYPITNPLDITACVTHFLFYDPRKSVCNIKPFWTEEGVYLNENFYVTYVREGRKILKSKEGLIEALLIGRRMFGNDATKGISEELTFFSHLFFMFFSSVLDVFSPALACINGCEHLTPLSGIGINKEYSAIFLSQFPELCSPCKLPDFERILF